MTTAAMKYGQWEVVNGRVKTPNNHKPHVDFVRLADDGELHVLKTQKRMNHTDDFREEIELACKMDHPNVIKVVDCDTGENPWMVTPYYSGGTLKKADFQKWTYQERCDCFKQICKATRYVESFGYAKADGGLNNILLKADGRTPVIADFYGCPELTIDSGAGSMLRLGAVFYELMTGRKFDSVKFQAGKIEKQIEELKQELKELRS